MCFNTEDENLLVKKNLVLRDEKLIKNLTASYVFRFDNEEQRIKQAAALNRAIMEAVVASQMNIWTISVWSGPLLFFLKENSGGKLFFQI